MKLNMGMLNCGIVNDVGLLTLVGVKTVAAMMETVYGHVFHLPTFEQ